MVVAALLSLLQRQTLLVTLLSLFVFPFLVNYISTIFFYRTFNSKKQGKKPPTIPYHVPGVFHALGLVSLGPQIYFAKLIKEYGGFSPFVIRAGTSAFVIIRDQKQIRNILLSSRQLTSEARRMQVYGHVIGAPHGILGIYRGGGKTTGEKSLVENVQQGLYRKHLTRPSLAANVEIYVTTLSNSLQNKMFQYGTWTQIQDLWSFFQHSITASTIEALFGPALLKQYPRVVRDYWEFEAGNDGFLRKYPRFMIPSAYAARDRLHLKLATWLHRNHSGEEFAKLTDDDPICDEFMGSKFIQERDEAFAKSDFQGARAAEILAVIHESNSNLIPSVFWIIVEVLRKPNLVKHLMTAIKQYCPPQTASYDVAAISNIPLIQSIQTEVGRLRMATSTIRTSEVDDFQLDENWVLPRGTPAIIFSHDVAMNTELWTEARPRTVDQPLKDFWAERFLVPENSKSPQTKEGSRQNKDKIESGSFNIDGLEHLDITFGSGHLACPGNHYAKAVQAATLALLLNDFEIELCDPDAVDAAMPVAGDIAYGSIKPLESIAIRIRKRRTGEMS